MSHEIRYWPERLETAKPTRISRKQMVIATGISVPDERITDHIVLILCGPKGGRVYGSRASLTLDEARKLRDSLNAAIQRLSHNPA
jgi:hypothetical protein